MCSYPKGGDGGRIEYLQEVRRGLLGDTGRIEDPQELRRGLLEGGRIEG